MAESLAAARMAYATPTPQQSALELARAVYPAATKAFFFCSREARTSTDAQYYTILLPDRIVFALRGSSSASDFFTDAIVWKTDCSELAVPSALVHAGFYDQFRSVKYDLLATVYAHARKRPVPRFEFVGHSLGGALATIAAAVTKALVPHAEVSCATFGSPRVGNGAFVAFFNERVDSVRYVHGNDMVTLVPRLWYEHVAGGTQLGPQRTDLLSTYVGVAADHSMDAYGKALPLGKQDTG